MRTTTTRVHNKFSRNWDTDYQQKKSQNQQKQHTGRNPTKNEAVTKCNIMTKQNPQYLKHGVLPFSIVELFQQSVERNGFSSTKIVPVGNYMFKVSNRNTRTKCEICSKARIKTLAF